jgi:hypothetical protein
MEIITINYGAVLAGAVGLMIIGAIWYGPLFGERWMKLNGVNPSDAKARKEMEKTAGPLYGIQFVLTLFQVLVLAHLVADTARVGGFERALWIWAAFVAPTLAGASMWTAEKTNLKWARFLIQAGYQFVIFVLFGLLFQLWQN